MIRKHWLILWIVLAAAILNFGCGNKQPASTSKPESGQAASEAADKAAQGGINEGGRTVTNLDGSLLNVPEKVNRVAALFGPSYEKVFMLGAEDKIIADGDFHLDGWPWSNKIYQRLAVIPGIPNAHTELDVETLLKYKPDVVFYWNQPKAVAKLNNVGIAAVPSVSTGRLEDTKKSVMVYAQVLGKKETAIAQKYAAYFDQKVKLITDVTAKIPESKRPSVYFANQKIIWTAGKSSDIPELIAMAGGKCVHAGLAGESKTEVSLEQLLKWDPQYIFIDHAGSSGNDSAEKVINSVSDDGRYKQLSAFKNNKVYICPTGVFFWDSGVQKILMLQWMAKQLHPQEFKDIDMNRELKYFYKEFFRL